MLARRGDLTEKWYEYAYRDRSDVRRFVAAYPDRRALSVSCDRVSHDYQFVRPLLTDPDEVLRAGKAALRRVRCHESDRDLEDVYLRLTDLPAESEVALADLGADHLNELRTLRGIVSETDAIRPKVIRAGFRCGKCEAVTRHVAQPGRRLRSHEKCPRCNSVGYLSFAPDASEYVDAQQAVVRDPDDPDESVAVLLEHDLAGSVAAGDRVRLVGVPRANQSGDLTIADTWIESVSMERLTDTDG